MSHAKVTEEHHKRSSEIAYAYVNKTFEESAQLLADAIRDARLKEAEWLKPTECQRKEHHALRSPICAECQKMARWEERIEAIKRGAA